ncbi:MAG TPA: HhH-GPD-type base excision DNA repair protein [Mycobacteriales bacterium]|jgi:uncharacterized HhH-GPD family protein|nr:HhH-GPD-type base excision DNA repair protein [Mycobacteriales bacterium]
MPEVRITGNTEADALLSVDPLALLVGMQLDQQVPMERAFAAPRALADRLGVDRLSAEALAEFDPDALVAVFSAPPALHRFPGSMAARVQQLCRALVDSYGGDPELLWQEAETGGDLLRRLRNLPGFGAQKAAIFLALLGKQYDVQPPGWREAAGPYGDADAFRSVADVTGPESLGAVREYKKQAKAAAKTARA